jgi:hypothetical protein
MPGERIKNCLKVLCRSCQCCVFDDSFYVSDYHYKHCVTNFPTGNSRTESGDMNEQATEDE